MALTVTYNSEDNGGKQLTMPITKLTLQGKQLVFE